MRAVPTTIGIASLLALSACLDPLVDDNVSMPGLILPAGSEVPSITTDEAELDEIEEYDGVGDLVPLHHCFGDGDPAVYWDFGPSPDISAPMFVLRKRDSDGNLQSIGHPNIIEAVPGDPGYSPFWAIWVVEVTDAYGGEVIPSLAALQEAEREGLVMAPVPQERFLNCPIVHPDVRLEVGGGVDPLEPTSVFYYDGLAVPYFSFGTAALADDNLHVPVQAVYVLKRSGEEPLNEAARGVDMTGDGDINDSNNIVESRPGDDNYTPLWRPVSVTVPSDYASVDTYQDELQADYKAATDLFTKGADGQDVPVPGHVIAFSASDLIVNCPVQRKEGGT